MAPRPGGKPPRSLNIVFAGGGTGGHLFPGLATADALRTMLGDVRITFAGSGAAFERRHVTAAGYEYLPLRSRPLKSSPWAWPGFFAAHWQGRHQAQAFLREQRVDLVIGLGGYASVPMASAATARGIPWCCSSKTRYLAEPIAGYHDPRHEFVSGSKPPGIISPACRRIIARHRHATANPREINERDHYLPSRPLLVICGGSGGARPLNLAVPQVLARMRNELGDWRILHQTGESGLAATGPVRAIADRSRRRGLRARSALGYDASLFGCLPGRRNDPGRIGGRRRAGDSLPLSICRR